MKKSIKKSLSLIFVMICVFVLSAPVVFAAEIPDVADESIVKEINKTNDYVFKAIDQAKAKAEKEVIKSLQNEQKQEALDESIDKLKEKLIAKTEKEVSRLIEKAAEEGIELERTYVDVTLYNQTFEVDPLYVH